jgi:hypothetical protein
MIIRRSLSEDTAFKVCRCVAFPSIGTEDVCVFVWVDGKMHDANLARIRNKISGTLIGLPGFEHSGDMASWRNWYSC